MSLNEDEARAAWPLFERSPLFTKWPGAAAEFDSLLEPVDISDNGVIYEPGYLATYLYLVVAGSVDQTVGPDRKRPWLRQRFGPGSFFGQMGLFTGQYLSWAVAAPDTVLYRMSAAGLRVALEQNPGLQDELMQDKRAGRLRRIPLFSSLSDADLRWLAQAVKEQDYAAGASPPLAVEPGLWIVDWGQIQVTGPANPYQGQGWETWGVTAGNFFLSTSSGMRYGLNCVAESARAALPSHLFYLPADAVDRLADAFLDVQRRMAQPVDIAGQMAQTGPFAGLLPRNVQHLAQHTSWEFVPAGQNITTQGSVGHSYVMIRDGAAVVTAVDERGRSRPQSYLKTGDSYGETSLLQGAPRDASVRAVRAREEDNPNQLHGAEIFVLNRLDLQHAFAKDPDLWHQGVSLYNRTVQIKAKTQPYKWMDEGETETWTKRPHWLWLMGPLLGTLALVLLGAVFLLWMSNRVYDTFQNPLNVAALICALPALIVLAGWIVVNYRDDYYVLTNRRITRRDRTMLLYEGRVEAPLDMVQDVTVNADFFGRLFNYGHVTVRTAAKDQTVQLANVPDPEMVKTAILIGRTEARAVGHGQQFEVLRRGLLTDLHLALPIPERARALGDQAKAPLKAGMFARGRTKPPGASDELLPGTKGSQGKRLRTVAKGLPEKWQNILFGPVKPPPQPLSGQLIWRKHWINLLARTIIPLGALVLVIAIGLIIGTADPPLFANRGWLLAWLFVFVLVAGWLWWNYEDWHNDIYVLTDDKIIDIERKPLGISSKRREGSLDRVQNVIAIQDGVVPNLLNYGNVDIKTAAGDEGYTFTTVANPKYVQSMVFQKLAVFRQRQESLRTQQRQRDFIEALRAYHELEDEQAGRNGGRY